MTRSLSKSLLVITLAGFATLATAENIENLEQAIEIAQSSDEVALSDAARISGLEVARFSNGRQTWTVKVFDQGQQHVFTMQSADSLRIYSSDLARNNNPAFWSELPEIEAFVDPFEYLERATADLAMDDASLIPRDKFIIEYKVCDPPAVGANAEPSGCRQFSSAPLEGWSVILQADQSDGGWVNKIIHYDGDQMTDIQDARVGGNW